ncbi:HAD-IIB family hydrolase [Intrasporangium sp.]|uniref:HAD family hydrolase n=1 Tax=Intrasporangium sp. TaxID=1925024 RepID=UPI00293B6733|nr:HAD-IIB family hydrolase [Intrasporangium sp.]MDV3222258.1 HAD-IIB family hydrolase [Intrasporangium sp.]
MEQRMVALDLDGTTLTHTGELSDGVRKAVAALPDDVIVVVATGRSIIATTPVLETLDIRQGFAVCANGAVTIEIDERTSSGYAIVDKVTFDPRPVLENLRSTLPTARIAVEELGVGFKVSQHFPEGELMGRTRVVDWDELVAHPVTRVTLRQPEATAEEFMDMVERAGLHGVSYAVGWSAWLDINPEGVSKASALELVRRRIGVEPIHTVAVGDQRNDLEMLHWAAWGVAMGNAPDEVKAIADEVTGDVEEDGLVPILEGVAEAARNGAPFRDGVPSSATARLQF